MNHLPDVDYIVWRIDETEAQLEASLSHPERYADKVKNLRPGSRRRLEVLAVRRALKELMNGEEPQVCYTSNGAPFLDGGPCLSISHTDGYVAVITADRPVGIDIERRGDRVERVVSHFLQPAEVAMAALMPDKTLALHLCWSAKEVAFKLLGSAYFDLQHLTSVQHIDPVRRTLILSAEGRHDPLNMYYDYTDDYVLVYAQL